MTLAEEVWFGRVVVVSAIIDLIVALAILLVRPGGEVGSRPKIGLKRVALAFGATSVVFAIKAVMLGAADVGLFGLIHLIYLDLVIVIPLIGIVLLVDSAWRPLTRPVIGLAIVSLIAIPIGWYATFREPFNLQTEAASVPISKDRAGRSPVRIAVMTDLQTRYVTDYERHAVDRLLGLKPDIILLPGDIFQGSDEALDLEFPALHDLLMKLDAPGGVYFAPGDVDHAPGRIERIFAGTKVKLLVNALERVEIRDRVLTIGGVELEYFSQAANRLIDRLEDLEGTDDVRILLSHRPDSVFRLREHSRVDLVVAGHTHGGQIVVPGFGPVMTLTEVPRKVAAGGLHAIDGNAIYVSRGVGCERSQAPRIRFLCPPEVSILTLNRAE